VPKSKCTRRRYRTLPVVGAARPWYQATRRFDLLSVFYNCLRSKRNCYKPLTLVKVPRPASQQQQQHQKEQHIHGISAEPLSLHATRLEINVERKCAENYNNWHDKFIFKTAVSIVVISNYNSFRVLFDKTASVYFIWKIYSYFSIGNGQPREPAQCWLYRHTFVPYRPSPVRCPMVLQKKILLKSVPTQPTHSMDGHLTQTMQGCSPKKEVGDAWNKT